MPRKNMKEILKRFDKEFDDKFPNIERWRYEEYTKVSKQLFSTYIEEILTKIIPKKYDDILLANNKYEGWNDCTEEIKSRISKIIN